MMQANISNIGGRRQVAFAGKLRATNRSGQSYLQDIAWIFRGPIPANAAVLQRPPSGTNRSPPTLLRTYPESLKHHMFGRKEMRTDSKKGPWAIQHLSTSSLPRNNTDLVMDDGLAPAFNSSMRGPRIRCCVSRWSLVDFIYGFKLLAWHGLTLSAWLHTLHLLCASDWRHHAWTVHIDQDIDINQNGDGDRNRNGDKDGDGIVDRDGDANRD